jgi:peptidoglycan/LPS O-acetylase OafA/YrhL
LLLVYLVGGNLEPTAPPAAATNFASWYVLAMTGPPVRFFEFLFGIGLGLLYVKHRDFRMPAWKWSLLEIVAILAIAVHAMTARTVLDLLGPALGPVFGQWYRHCGAFLVFGFAIMCFAYRGGVVSRVLSLPLFVLLGEISFSTYMIHQIVIRIWGSQGWLVKEWNPFGLAVILMTIYVGSYLSWRFFERPAQRAILALAGPRPTLART